MNKIPTELFKPKVGTMNGFLFANPNAGIDPTLYYEITIPLEPFDPDLEWEPGPVETEFRLESLELAESDWRKLDGRSFTLSEEQSDCSIYLGGGHCPVDVKRLRFSLVDKARFHIQARLFCLFEDEGIGKNATVSLEADLNYEGLVMDIDKGITGVDSTDEEAVRRFLGQFVALDAYDPEVQGLHYSGPELFGYFTILKANMA